MVHGVYRTWRGQLPGTVGAMWPMFTTHGPHVATTIPGLSTNKSYMLLADNL